MMVAPPALLALAQHCAPGIAPEAILSIVSVESHRDPLAINVNRVGELHAASAVEAVASAKRWIDAGYSVDLGLAQINSGNLSWTGLSVSSAFEPCANLGAAEKILERAYARASREATGLDAISRTFSLYNSGNTASGFSNNYVSRVWRAAGEVISQIQAIGPLDPAVAALADGSGSAAPAAPARSAFVVGPSDVSVLIFK